MNFLKSIAIAITATLTPGSAECLLIVIHKTNVDENSFISVKVLFLRGKLYIFNVLQSCMITYNLTYFFRV